MKKHRFLLLIALFVELGACTASLLAFLPLLVLQFIFFPSHLATCVVLAFWVTSWWLMTPRYELHNAIAPPELDALQQMVDTLTKELNAPKIHRIVLNDELNAAAAQSSGLFSTFFVRRTLILGIPLLASLSAAEVRAVIAHELGHFSRNHNKTGQWLYRVRNRWSHLLPNMRKKTSMLSRILKPVSLVFIPYFLRETSDWSKYCEFEADRSVHRINLVAELGTGLARLGAVGIASDWQNASDFAQVLHDSDIAPNDFWHRVLVHASSNWSAYFEHSKVRTLQLGSHLLDTHPPYQERMLALGITETPKLTQIEKCAGEILFPSNWHILLSEANVRWQETQKIAWQLAHLRWHGQQEISFHQLSSTDLTYQKATAQLRAGSAQGVDELKSIIRSNPSYGLMAAKEILYFEQQHGSHASIDKAVHRYEHYANQSGVRQTDLIEKLKAGQFSSLPSAIHHRIAHVLQRYDIVDAAWCITIPGPFSALKYPQAVWFLVRVDPKICDQTGTSENSVATQFSQFVSAMMPANYRYLTYAKFSTEPLNPIIFRSLQSLPACCLIQAKTPINTDILAIDKATVGY
jgi:Zn-dependent protease with chaperone function